MTTNDQFKVENRRNWKAEIFDYDAIQAYENRECQYCLTDAQVAVLGGLIETLGWATRWQSNTQEIDSAWVRDFKNDIARRLMLSCCGDDLIYTYDEDGNLEVSDDGGTTYTPAPQDDIRVNPTVKYPEPPTVEGEDLKCISADGAIKLIKEQIGDQLTDDMSRYTLGQLIKDWTDTIVGTSNPFQALANIITNQIFALLISAVRAALTDDVYEKLQCILYCNMSDSIFFDGGAWATVRSQILSDIPGIAGVFLEHLIYLIGNGGLSNLVRAGAGTTDANCEDCDCVGGCDADVFSTLYLGTIIDTGAHHVTIQAENNPGIFGTYRAAIGSNNKDICCCFILELLEGTPLVNQGKYIPCGVPLGGEESYTHINTNVLVNGSTAAYDLDEPFQLKISFVECP